jgi:predicted deacetylase
VRGVNAGRRRVAVAIHDVEPGTFERVAAIRQWLLARGIDRTTLLVVPAARLHPFDSVRPELADWLRGRVADGDCVAQHGLRHLRTHAAGPLGSVHARLAGGRSAEFAGLDSDATAAAVETGLRLLARAGLRPLGFVAPAYLYTRPLRGELATRFSWWADLWAVCTSGRDLPVPALSLGTSSLLRRATSPVLLKARAARAGAVMRLDLHPADFDHAGHVATIDQVLARAVGRATVTYDELVASRGVSAGAGRRTAGGPSHPVPVHPEAVAARRIRRR